MRKQKTAQIGEYPICAGRQTISADQHDLLRLNCISYNSLY